MAVVLLPCTCRASRRTYSSLAATFRPSTPSPPTPLPRSDHTVPPKPLRKSDWKRRQEGSNFVDTLSLNVFSGKGGAGGVAFHREKFKAKGPPSGGPGGAGGSVYLLATTSITSLSHLPRTARAGAGLPGGGKWLAGKRGEDVVIRVPVGTVVREVRLEEGEEVERDKEDREEMEWAWDASKVRLAEAEQREKRWDAWKELKDAREKEGGDRVEPFEELEVVDVGEHKQAALERLRRELFVTYPMADLSSHPQFLYAEHQLLSKLLSREAVIPGRKTRRRRRKRVDEDDTPLFLDLTKPTPLGQPILLVSGGQPGLGNPSFQSAEDRSPKYATKGGDGDMMRLELELKAGGEVGLVGMPNAGKSTILRALTSSTPRVAAYPFTTLNPHHGTCVIYSDGTFSGPPRGTSITDTDSTPTAFSGSEQLTRLVSREPSYTGRTEQLRFTITDNPGLVPQSSLNVGLGHAFLRHVERCSALVYVVDISANDPIGALEAVRTELREYTKVKGLPEGLLEGRVRGVVVNKADRFGESREVDEDGQDGECASAEEGRVRLAELLKFVKEMEVREVAEGVRQPEDTIWVVPTSAKNRENVGALVVKLAETVKAERAREAERVADEERAEMEEREATLAGIRGE